MIRSNSILYGSLITFVVTLLLTISVFLAYPSIFDETFGKTLGGILVFSGTGILGSLLWRVPSSSGQHSK
jgi:uncharacterized membrane protein YkgB